MRNRSTLPFLLICFSLTVCWNNLSHGQTVVWSEPFDLSTVVGPGGWDLAFQTGTNDADANFFTISDAEGGVAPTGCGVANNGDQTLHITSTLLPTAGAAYNAGGFCGLGICVETHIRAQSAPFTTAGSTGLTLEFDYIANGSPGSDYGTVWYNDGTGWTQLGTALIAPTCPSGQGQWTAFSMALPASCDNNPAVQIGFGWDNNDDGAGTDPSYAVNNVEVVTAGGASPAPVADFSASSTTLCEGDCINFTDLSSNSPTGWNWTFPGSSTATSTQQNPTNICYPTAGTYDVTLSATNANGTDDTTMVAYITVNPCNTPNANFTTANTTICEGDCIGFQDLTSGSPTSWNWTFTGATTTSSTDQNPTNICYPTAGTYDVTLSASNANGTDDTTMTAYITVIVCGNAPTPNFSASNTSLCEDDCIDFTDLSTGGASAWNWSFPGSTQGSSTAQNPTGICYPTAGTYDVTLSVTNANGTADTTIASYIVVTTCTTPTAAFTPSQTTICTGSCITFADASTGGVTGYQWTFNGGSPASANTADPGTICYSGAGTYDVELIVTNSAGSDTMTTTITVNAGPGSIDAGPDQSMESGQNVTIVVTGGGSGSYLWVPSSGLDCDTCASVIATPLETTAYVVYYTENGCTVTDTVIVDVTVLEAYGIPNAFSPNGDGFNDVLYVRGNGISGMRLVIYNRYGQLVFESVDQAVGWDGTHNGKTLNPGVFTYYLEVNFSTGDSEVVKGNITLMK